MSLTTAGKNASTMDKKPAQAPIIVRRAHLTDGPRMGWIAALACDNQPITNGLSPYRDRYYGDYIRACQQRATAAMFNPRNIAFVAAEASHPSVAIGYARFSRLGNDESAKRQIANRKGVWMWLLGWLFWAFCEVFNRVKGGDRSLDPDAKREFIEAEAHVEERYYKEYVPERDIRWHVQNCSVLPGFQRRGVGKLLMKEVIDRAENEEIPIYLEASREGEKLYERLGFKLMGRFAQALFGQDGNEGGVMMWSPLIYEKEGK